MIWWKDLIFNNPLLERLIEQKRLNNDITCDLKLVSSFEWKASLSSTFHLQTLSVPNLFSLSFKIVTGSSPTGLATGASRGLLGICNPPWVVPGGCALRCCCCCCCCCCWASACLCCSFSFCCWEAAAIALAAAPLAASQDAAVEDWLDPAACLFCNCWADQQRKKIIVKYPYQVFILNKSKCQLLSLSIVLCHELT